MNETQFATISNSELEDFKKICDENHLNPKDFTFKEHEVTKIPTGGFIFSYFGKLTITKNGKSRTYDTGNQSTWLSDFKNDLHNDFYKAR